MREPLSGKKSYVVAAGMILYAVGGLMTGNLDANEAFELILQAAALIALRLGVAKGGQA